MSDAGLIWLQLDSGEWVRAYTDGERVWRVQSVGEGVLLKDLTAAIVGPLRSPGPLK